MGWGGYMEGFRFLAGWGFIFTACIHFHTCPPTLALRLVARDTRGSWALQRRTMSRAGRQLCWASLVPPSYAEPSRRRWQWGGGRKAGRKAQIFKDKFYPMTHQCAFLLSRWERSDTEIVWPNSKRGWRWQKHGLSKYRSNILLQLLVESFGWVAWGSLRWVKWRKLWQSLGDSSIRTQKRNKANSQLEVSLWVARERQILALTSFTAPIGKFMRLR